MRIKEPDKWERIRRLRYGHVLKLILFRYGARGVTDDDAGRPDLMELLYLASQSPSGAEKKVVNLTDLYAPWMQGDESEPLIHLVMTTPNYQKARTAADLGALLKLKNEERERLRLWSIRPYDLNPEQFDEQSKARSLERLASRRRRGGVKPRAEYLAELRAKPKPWEGSGLSRWQWYRRRNKVCPDSKRGLSETSISKAETHPVAAQAESQQGQQGRGAKMPRETAKTQQVEGNKQGGSSAEQTHPVAPSDDLARVRAEMEKRNLDA